MSSKKKEVELKLIRTDTRLLTCKLKPEEIENAGRELATITQQIEGEKARQKAIKAELNATMTALVSKQSVMASRINRGEEERNVNVRVELHPSGQVTETREDTGAIIGGPREALPGELQLPLAPAEEPNKTSGVGTE